MDDNELDKMLELLKDSTPPEPSESAKNMAISRAMEEFDKKKSPVRQGTNPLNRLMDTVLAVHETITGANFMKREFILAGGLSFAAIIAVLMTTSNLVPSPPMQTAQVTSNLADVKTAEKKSVWHMEEETAKDKADMPVAAVAPMAPPITREFKAEREIAAAPEPAPMPLSKPVAPQAELSPILKSVRSDAPKEKTANYAARAVAGSSARGMVADSMMPQPEPYSPPSYHDEGHDKFQDVKANPTKLTKEEPVSTFSVDVDTSSYSFMRASINNNALPQKDAVRIEEMINYFPYDYDAPKDKSEPFKANVSVFPTPWNPDTKLMHIGIKGYQLEQKEKPHSNLVFLIDTSGSMNEQNKLPLLKNSLKLLLDSLKPDDTVAIVTYAGSAGVALEPTKASDKYKISSVLDGLGAGGSTAGAQGIKTAYELAESHFDKDGVNRVILATDGDFNVGITNTEELKSYIERKRDNGVFLSVLGFGRGNYNDALMQALAQNGNGNAAYIDNLSEARKALVEESSATLFTIAKDVKIQVEFNPEQVSEYRLIGYETRILNREDFNNDKVDAGDIGSGHTITAIYEITPLGSRAKLIDDSRYQKPSVQTEKKDNSQEYAFVKIRYKLPDSSTSKLITTAVDSKVEYKNISEVPTDAKFATSVAGFAQLLRGDHYIKSYSYDDVINMAQSAKGDDKFGYRSEFINMARLAKTMSQGRPVNPTTQMIE